MTHGALQWVAFNKLYELAKKKKKDKGKEQKGKNR